MCADLDAYRCCTSLVLFNFFVGLWKANDTVLVVYFVYVNR